MLYIFNTEKEVEHAMLGLMGIPLWASFWIRPFADIVAGIFGILLSLDAESLFAETLPV